MGTFVAYRTLISLEASSYPSYYDYIRTNTLRIGRNLLINPALG